MKLHLPRRPASRWRLGRALCGAKIGTGTPLAKAAGEATCEKCRERIDTRRPVR